MQDLFKRFEHAGDGADREKQRLVDAMTTALSKHAGIEEQVLYPWARDSVRGIDDDVLEAFEEHRTVKWLLTELRTLDAGDERFDARVTVMIELVRHHVEEEEDELFPRLRRAASRTELLELGDRLRAAESAAPTEPDLGPHDGRRRCGRPRPQRRQGGRRPHRRVDGGRMTARVLPDADVAGLDEYVAAGGGRALEASGSVAPDELIATVLAAGLRGPRWRRLPDRPEVGDGARQRGRVDRHADRRRQRRGG